MAGTEVIFSVQKIAQNYADRSLGWEYKDGGIAVWVSGNVGVVKEWS